MDPFTVLSGIETCWKAGQFFMEAYQSWKKADKEISEQCVTIEYVWIKTKLQIEVMDDILPPDSKHRKHVDDSARVLSGKLTDAVAAIDEVIKRKPGVDQVTIKKTKYLLLKDAINKAVRDLEDWQRRFDPSWFLILRIAENKEASVKPKLNDAAAKVKELAKEVAGAPSEKNNFDLAKGLLDVTSQPDGDSGIFFPEKKFDKRPIPYSTAVFARLPQRTPKWLIIDSIQCDEQVDRDELTRSVRLLASKLRRADPLTFGLLNCQGVMKVNGAKPSFDFILNTPNGKDTFRSLRGALLSQDVPSLSQRLSIAKELTKSISYMHTFDFVHKNIRPETILLFDDTETKRSLTFLVGFEGFRSVDGATAQRGDAELHRDLYRHPSRQGQSPEQRYSMEHDIYSLGVCLLEIGLWKSFVAYNASEEPQPGPSRDQYSDWLKKQKLETAYNPSFYLKDWFEEQAKTDLPERAGDMYANIVIKCLRCLDSKDRDGTADIDETDSKDPMIAAGVKFIRDILLRVDELVI
ncbi:hypothetical protein E0Z10_g243 [Xylaria hypoxylon]|uniref:Protein kinase domain-containing protein n=1 Tax=Xylaria hypoxylon TaxID=37992 RepID=A0A4Z0ZBZ7_9PEZI|nr:hypothetical protein E0Z10_g243 [Xylaria hypoxylon]